MESYAEQVLSLQPILIGLMALAFVVLFVVLLITHTVRRRAQRREAAELAERRAAEVAAWRQRKTQTRDGSSDARPREDRS